MVFLSLPQTDDQQNKIQGSLAHRNARGTEKPATAWKWEEEMDILQTVHQLQEEKQGPRLLRLWQKITVW